MKIIKGGKEERLARARELIFRFGVTGDESCLDEVREMARRDQQRAKLHLIQPSSADSEDQPPHNARPSPRR